jgi:diamine N-acetyltransferase
MNKHISDSIETNRLIIADAKVDECDTLQRIGEGWVDKVLVEGEPFESGYINNCLAEGDLPPIVNAKKQNYRLKSIFLKEKGVLIGFIDLYHGYPTDDTAWISLMVLDENFQGNGYAKEVMDCIAQECRKIGFKKIGIGVYLKNWRALRFWTKIGFDKITGITGDENFGENTFAIIKLEKIL